MNVSVKPNLPKKQLNKLALTRFSSFLCFHFPSLFLSDHSDPLKFYQLSLNANHQRLLNHLKAPIKHTSYTEAVAERLAKMMGSPELSV